MPESQPELPDLVVELFSSSSDNGLSAGAPFTLRASVRNLGDAASAPTTLRYYQSTDATVTTADTQVGASALRGIAASGSASESVELPAPSSAGTYYYGACVDAVNDESDKTNNCSTSFQVKVNVLESEPPKEPPKEPPMQRHPDLVVLTSAVSDSTPAASAALTLSATVSNAGDGDATGTTLRYYRSTDGTIATSDTEVGAVAISELGASGSSSQSVDLMAPSSSGIYYYGACVDAVPDESDTANNCSAAVQVTVPERTHPDLTVTTPAVSDRTPAAGAAFTLSATASNVGDGDAAATTLRYYQSTDATIEPFDTEVGTNAIAARRASGSSSQSVDLTAPASPGTYYYGACVDAVTDESDTRNNCSSAVQVTVEATMTEPQGHPDLLVRAPSVTNATPAAGAQFTLSATVSNVGDGDAVATTLRYYRSTDAAIATSDTEVGTDAISTLGNLGSSSQSVDLAAPASPGAYYYGACVDAVTDESDTANNCSTAVQVTVPAPRLPDLVVTAPSVTDATPAAGAAFTLSATVSNTGDGDAVATTLRYYRSTDAAIATSDTEVGTDAISTLGNSGSSSQSVDLAAPASPGAYYYGACVDAVTDESDTANNCSTAVQVTVPAPRPDLVVGSPSPNPSSPEAGAAFTLSATVSNTGDGEAAATTLRYYQSTDATVTASDTEVGTQAVAGMPASVALEQPISLTAPATAGTYYYAACVDAVDG